MNNFTAGVREREDSNRTREAGNRDGVEGVVANTLKLYRHGAVGFIDWLDPLVEWSTYFLQLLFLILSNKQDVEILIATEQVTENLADPLLQ